MYAFHKGMPEAGSPCHRVPNLLWGCIRTITAPGADSRFSNVLRSGSAPVVTHNFRCALQEHLGANHSLVNTSSANCRASVRVMFCDLCFAWQETNGLTQRERLVMAIRLGIDLFALSHDVSETLTDRDRCVRPQVSCVSILDMLL